MKKSFTFCWEKFFFIFNNMNNKIYKNFIDIKKIYDFFIYEDNFQNIYSFILKLDKIPLDYLIKETNFYGRKFFIQENVYIPKVVSEFFVDYVSRFKSISNLNILELCSGSGAIFISLSLLSPGWKVFGIECHLKSFLVSKININKYLLNNRCQVIYDNMFNLFKYTKFKNFFDIIVINLPYVELNHFNKLSNLVKKQNIKSLYSNNLLFDIINILKLSNFLLKKNNKSLLLIETSNFFLINNLNLSRLQEKFIMCDFIVKKDYNILDRFLVVNFNN